MAALTIGGTDVPVQEWEWDEPIRIGDEATAIDGSDLSTTDGYKARGRGRTTWLGSAAHATILAVLETAGSQTIAGDLSLGVTAGRVTVGRTTPRYDGAAPEFSTAFTVTES